MSEDGPAVTALPGAPETWLATLRDCFRHVRSASPARAELVAWLADNTAADEEAAAETLLDFFERVRLVDPAAENSSLGPNGREYLDTHDEAVLYEALAESMPGIAALTEVLAIRPVTDVEIADLLERELDGAVENPTIYRQWLQALGYVDYDDGVADLTERGRRLVDADETLSDGASARLPSTRAAAAADPPVEEADSVSDVTASGPSSESTTAPSTTERAEPPASVPEATDSEVAARHDYRCMVCGERRQRGPQTGYAEIHYLMPLEDDGPENDDNAVIVCPNHRADFEHGLVRVDPQSLTIEHAYDDDVSGRTLRTVDDHTVGAQYLAYHNDVVAEF